MNNFTQSFIQENIGTYYNNVTLKPFEISQREVGYGTIDQKIAVRHLAYKNVQEFNEFLRKVKPFYISASSAYYNLPHARPMKSKEWQGADLIFDLDLHPEEWDPKNEYKAYHNLMHPLAFEKVKGMLIKLVEEFLVTDFGFSIKDMKVNFSGNRGYHVRIYDKIILKLTSRERREIVDHIAGRGIKFDEMFMETEVPGKRKGALQGPKPSDAGWSGRIAQMVMNIEPHSPVLPPGIKSRKTLDKFKQGVLKGRWDNVYIPNKEDVWATLIKEQSVNLGEPTDVNVTIDTARLLRVPNTIHGSSSLIAKEFDFSEVDKFNPLRDCLAFDDDLNFKEDLINIDTSNISNSNIGNNVLNRTNNIDTEDNTSEEDNTKSTIQKNNRNTIQKNNRNTIQKNMDINLDNINIIFNTNVPEIIMNEQTFGPYEKGTHRRLTSLPLYLVLFLTSKNCAELGIVN